MTQPTIAPRRWDMRVTFDSINGTHRRNMVTVIGETKVRSPFLLVVASEDDDETSVCLTLDSAKELVNQIQTAIKLLEDETKTDRD